MSEGESDEILGWTQLRQVVQGLGFNLGSNWEPLESLEEKWVVMCNLKGSLWLLC